MVLPDNSHSKKIPPPGDGPIEDAHALAAFTWWTMTLKSKKESYQDNERVRFDVHSVEPLNSSQRVVDILQEFAADMEADAAAAGEGAAGL